MLEKPKGLRFFKENISPMQSFLVLNRSPMVLAFVLPVSRVFQMWDSLRTTYIQALSSAPARRGLLPLAIRA